MKITIHRGIDQIGGCITEIATATSRVFVDMGDNLPGEANLSEEEKSDFVQKIFSNDRRDNEAVVYTHGHGDHVGLMPYVPADVPQYLSEGTRRMLLDRYERLAKIDSSENERWMPVLQRTIVIPKELHIGDITLRPFKVSHSAYDSKMFLIEADGERILHTGDFRGHGYFSQNLFSNLEEFAAPVDYLIMEGTMLHRGHAETESKIADDIQTIIERHKHVVVLTSAMSWERIMSVFDANKRSKTRKPIITLSTHWQAVMEIYAEESPTHSSIYKNYCYYFNGTNPKLENWIKERGMVILAGSGHVDTLRTIMKKYADEDIALVFSMWKGYLSQEQRKIAPAFGEIHDMFIGKEIKYLHTSGHADVKTLRDVIIKMNPRKAIIGIHKEPDASLSELNIPQCLMDRIIPDKLSLENVLTL